MFEFLVKKLFKKMVRYVDSIKLAIYSKLWPELESKHDREKAKYLSAAVVNKLFGSPSGHQSIPATLIDEVATEFIRDEKNNELLYAIVMSLRTLATVEAGTGNIDALERIGKTIQWIKTMVPLPSEKPDPEMMKKMADTLLSRYCHS